MRQGIAPWRGIGDVLAPDDFFLILEAAMRKSQEREHIAIPPPKCHEPSDKLPTF
jgi:hypothetical protein